MTTDKLQKLYGIGISGVIIISLVICHSTITNQRMIQYNFHVEHLNILHVYQLYTDFQLFSFRFLARRTDAKFNKIILRRLFMSKYVEI